MNSSKHNLTFYNALDMKLAHLLGWTNLQVGGTDEGMKIPATWLIGHSPDVDAKLGKEPAPKWSRDIGSAAKVAIDHGIRFYAEEENDKAYAVLDIDPEHTWHKPEDISRHESKYVACATAVVHMLIDKLEYEKEQKEKEAQYN